MNKHRSSTSAIAPRIFYIAHHFPPALGSSGAHRTLANVTILSQHANCTVITGSIGAYPSVDTNSIQKVPKQVSIVRAWSRSTEKSFSVRGKYFKFMALPDNWQSWIVTGVISGLWHAIKRRPDVIVTTYPITSALFIGLFLKVILRAPWIVDLRDPMLQDDYPTDPTKRKIFAWLENKIIRHASVVTVTTRGTRQFYQTRFPSMPESFWRVIANGFAPEVFDKAEAAAKRDVSAKPFVLLHSGLIYPSERDPTTLLQTISELKQQGAITGQNFQLVLRASGHDEMLRPVLEQLEIADIVLLKPLIPFEDAVQEMFEAHALLLLQHANCNLQIPAKAYEYLRVGSPLLALTPQEGNTAELLSQFKQCKICPLDDKVAIKQVIIALLSAQLSNSVTLFSRTELAQEFSKIVDEVISSPGTYRQH